jgi:hypothetical protein
MWRGVWAGRSVPSSAPQAPKPGPLSQIPIRVVLPPNQGHRRLAGLPSHARMLLREPSARGQSGAYTKGIANRAYSAGSACVPPPRLPFPPGPWDQATYDHADWPLRPAGWRSIARETGTVCRGKLVSRSNALGGDLKSTVPDGNENVCVADLELIEHLAGIPSHESNRRRRWVP